MDDRAEWMRPVPRSHAADRRARILRIPGRPLRNPVTTGP
jgi:hypothetical protein